jgi:hypothetical protein
MKSLKIPANVPQANLFNLDAFGGAVFCDSCGRVAPPFGLSVFVGFISKNTFGKLPTANSIIIWKRSR